VPFAPIGIVQFVMLSSSFVPHSSVGGSPKDLHQTTMVLRPSPRHHRNRNHIAGLQRISLDSRIPVKNMAANK
jgi:hypothetical protein